MGRIAVFWLVACTAFGQATVPFVGCKSVAHRAFVDQVKELFDSPPEEFPVGSYPGDRLTYKSAEVAEHETWPQLGCGCGFRRTTTNMRGVAILNARTFDLLLLSVRLPADLSGLTDTIIQQVERDAQKEVK